MKKILFLTSHIPIPPNSGDRIAIVNTASIFKKMGFDVDILTLNNSNNSNRADDLNRGISPFTKFFIVHKTPSIIISVLKGILLNESAVFIRFRSREIEKVLRNISEDYDIIYSHHNYMAQYFYKFESKALLINDIHVLEYNIYKEKVQKSSNRIMRKIWQLESKRLFNSEVKAMKASDINFAYSEKELLELSSIGNGINIVLRPLAIQSPSYRIINNFPISYKKLRLLFFGDHRWFPNYDASKYIITEIAPLLQTHVNDIQITICGRNIPREFFNLVRPLSNVFLKGEVDDIREEIKNHHLILAPVRIGGGVRLKIIESLSLGKVVITTSAGAEGVIDKDCLLICDKPEIVVQTIIMIKKNPRVLHDYSIKSYKYFKEKHSLESGESFFKEVLKIG